MPEEVWSCGEAEGEICAAAQGKGRKAREEREVNGEKYWEKKLVDCRQEE